MSVRLLVCFTFLKITVCGMVVNKRCNRTSDEHVSVKSHWGPNSQERGLVLILVWLFSLPETCTVENAQGVRRKRFLSRDAENVFTNQSRKECGPVNNEHFE